MKYVYLVDTENDPADRTVFSSKRKALQYIRNNWGPDKAFTGMKDWPWRCRVRTYESDALVHWDYIPELGDDSDSTDIIYLRRYAVQ